MRETILMWVAVLLSFVLTYVGLYLGVRPLGHEHRKRVVIALCFVCSAVALIAAMYIGSKNG
jgi:predicted Na+-dependent transporter